VLGGRRRGDAEELLLDPGCGAGGDFDDAVLLARAQQQLFGPERSEGSVHFADERSHRKLQCVRSR
jgi:hypothetical protein